MGVLLFLFLLSVMPASSNWVPSIQAELLKYGYKAYEIKKLQVVKSPSKSMLGPEWNLLVNGTFYDPATQNPNPVVANNRKLISSAAWSDSLWRRGMIVATQDGWISLCRMTGKVVDSSIQLDEIEKKCVQKGKLSDVMGGGAFLIENGKFTPEFFSSKSQYWASAEAVSSGRKALHTFVASWGDRIFVVQNTRTKEAWNFTKRRAGEVVSDFLAIQDTFKKQGALDSWNLIKFDGGSGFFSCSASGCSGLANNPTGILVSY